MAAVRLASHKQTRRKMKSMCISVSQSESTFAVLHFRFHFTDEVNRDGCMERAPEGSETDVSHDLELSS